ncbi:unnamed protein product [Didymodactylos carnosus]|uniref:Uncharacterized protein n=2 Tax=Didymodactylos carnosus TaxID=1234261 RepID=A0A8S2FFH3_9BILA|nr:unnamed protein product [Didymodactylos carnosus]CAF4243011.1 unnamed protein product [Didymodactylos carnosus]
MSSNWEKSFTIVGGTEGFLAAVKQLGSDYRELDVEGSNGYTKSDGIWGRLAERTQIPKKDTYETRKWLYTTWQENRRKVRTTFFNTQVNDLLENLSRTSNKDEQDNHSHVETMSNNASLLTIPSTVPKAMRSKDILAPRFVHHFAMNYEQWRAFYNHKSGDVHDNWGNQLVPHFIQLGMTCAIVFRYHHVRGKNSRKKNCNLFSGRGHCKGEKCPVEVTVEVEDEPKNKASPCLFKVVIIGDKNHPSKEETMARQLTGDVREAMVKQVQKIGALGVYERNLRYANEDPLKEGNFTEVPSIDVLKTAKQQYNKKYRLDEDYFKELRMFGFFTRCTDDESEDTKAKNFYILLITDILRCFIKFF